jgi:hypothetical protein
MRTQVRFEALQKEKKKGFYPGKAVVCVYSASYLQGCVYWFTSLSQTWAT